MSDFDRADVRIIAEEWRRSRTLGLLTDQEIRIGEKVLDRLIRERGWRPPEQLDASESTEAAT